MQKTFIMALNAAAAFAAIDFKGVSVEPTYGSVMSEMTYSDASYDLTFNWGSAELKSEGKSAYVLAAAFQVRTSEVPDGTSIHTTASFEDPAAPGKTESWTCTVNYTKPARDTLGEYEAEGGIAKTASDATVAHTLTSMPVDAWFADDTQSATSYSSWFEWLPIEAEDATPEAEAEGEAPAEVEVPAKNSWQLCSAARIITSDIAGLVAGSGLEWKMGTAYTMSNTFSISGDADISGTDVEVTVAESGAMARFAAAATALIAMYAF